MQHKKWQLPLHFVYLLVEFLIFKYIVTMIDVESALSYLTDKMDIKNYNVVWIMGALVYLSFLVVIEITYLLLWVFEPKTRRGYFKVFYIELIIMSVFWILGLGLFMDNLLQFVVILIYVLTPMLTYSAIITLTYLRGEKTNEGKRGRKESMQTKNT